jgi:regulatory protein SWI6
MSVNNVAVMRRRSDSWLNATQILKVAGIDKGKRTKVLEKEILTGDHEKVQGGYGKYQGTWIKYERGVEFCRQYGVEEILRPLLEYDMGNDGVGGAGQGGVETPTKEQAMAAQRKRLYNSGLDNRPNGQSANGTFFKNISNTASNAVAAISKARFDSPGPRVSSGTHRPGSSRKMSQHQSQMGSQEPAFSIGSQQSMMSQSSFGGDMNVDSTYGTQSGVYITNGIQEQARNGDMQEPPRKRMRTSPSRASSFQIDGSGDFSIREETPTEPNESFHYSQQLSQNLKPEDEGVAALPPLPHPEGKEGEHKQQLLGSACTHDGDFSEHPCFLELSGEDLDIPLDNSGHTTLHWAATLAVLPLLKALVAGGASIARVNNGGETALMRAVSATNNVDRGSFPEVLELLGPTIEIRDARGRTVLHHIAVSSAIKGRSAASRYYLESLLEFVVRQGSAPSSQQSSFNAGPTGTSSTTLATGGVKAIGLGRFMSEIVNARDKSGDTALNIAARIGNRSIIQQLLEVGADPGIPNRAGLRPIDFGIGEEAKTNGDLGRGSSLTGKDILRRGEISTVVGETSKEIMSCKFWTPNICQVEYSLLYSSYFFTSGANGERFRRGNGSQARSH